MRRRESGLAAITAIMIVAVAASAAALMLSQQSALLDQALMVSARAQADLYAQAGIDWARGVLAEDAARSGHDALDEGWARPIAALPVERAVVSGALEDEQGKLNLNNVANGGSRSEPDLRMLQNLLAQLGLPPESAEAVLDWVDRDADLAGSGGAEDAYYLGLARPYRAANAAFAQVEELYRVRGFDAKAVAALKPHVSALPGRTPVNVNTATQPVIAALLGPDGREAAALVVAERAKRPFRQKADFAARLATLGLATPPAESWDVKSAHFLARVQVAQDEVRLSTEALLQRRDDGATTLLWRRPVY